MNAAGPPDVSPENAQRVADVVELLAKLAGSLAIIWAFLVRPAKPLIEWRRRTRAEAIRGVLQEELQCINDLKKREDGIDEKLDLALARQEQVFDELDLFVLVVADNRDRLDDMAELLNAAGFASRDRRESEGGKRRLADEALAELQGKLRSRRRKEDQLDRAD